MKELEQFCCFIPENESECKHNERVQCACEPQKHIFRSLLNLHKF